LRLDTSLDKKQRAMVVDGAVRQAVLDTRSLAAFVSRLRIAGYEVSPLESKDAAHSVSSFSYRLTKNKVTR
jgi:uncharacterized protein with von Willebrand factor type A (vWA) domain